MRRLSVLLVLSAIIVPSGAQSQDTSRVPEALVRDTVVLKQQLDTLSNLLVRERFSRILSVADQQGISAAVRGNIMSGVAESLLAPAEAASVTAQARAGVIARPSEPAARQEAAQLVRNEGLRLSSHFSLAQAFGETAEAMSVMPPTALPQVMRGLELAERTTSTLSFLAATAGGLAYLGNRESTGGSLLSLAGLMTVGQQFFGMAGDRRQRLSSSEVVEKAVTQAHQHASRVALNAVLAHQMSQSAAALRSLAELSRQLGDLPDPALITKSQTLEATVQYATLLRNIDSFYDAELSGMASELRRHKDSSAIFTPESCARMESLADTIDQAIHAWRKARHLYIRSERVAQAYVETHGTD
jgi:hypothetical protein